MEKVIPLRLMWLCGVVHDLGGRIMAGIFLILLGTYFIWGACYCYKKGEFIKSVSPFGCKVAKRSEEPILYFVGVIVWGSIGVFLVALTIRAFLHLASSH